MIYDVMGCKLTDFTNDDGERIQGVKLYLNLEDDEDDSFYGIKATSRFIATDSKYFEQVQPYVDANIAGKTPEMLRGCKVDMEFTEDKRIRKFKLMPPSASSLVSKEVVK